MVHHARSARLNRRAFLKRSAITGTAAVAAGVWSGRGPAASKSPNEKLNIGCIGVGNRGWIDMNHVAGENIVAVCDVDERYLARAHEKFPKAKQHSDFRKLLDQKDVDAVTVSTPDHTHAPATVMAMRLGKHVYCQKPLTHSVYEARGVKQVARETGVATQMGNQGKSMESERRMVELIRAGAIGEVREVHCWTNRPSRAPGGPGWPQGVKRPKETPPVPHWMHWDLWIGPAPWRPWHPAYHPDKWRAYWDFGTGALGNMGCHGIGMPFWALKLAAPGTVETESSEVTEESAPKWSIVRYRFPARGKLPPVTLTWYDGGRRPPEELFLGEKPTLNGTLVMGSEGTLFVPFFWGAGKLLPGAKFADYKRPEPTLPRSPGHEQEWIEACKGGPPALSNFGYAAELTELVLLGNVALRTGQRITWDAANMKCPGCPEADRFIRREYREGWRV